MFSRGEGGMFDDSLTLGPERRLSSADRPGLGDTGGARVTTVIVVIDSELTVRFESPTRPI